MPKSHKPSAVTLAQAAHLHAFDLEAGGRAEATRYWYRTVTERYVRFLGESAQVRHVPLVTDLTPEYARAFILWLRNTDHPTNALTQTILSRGARSIQDHVRALKGFARFCTREGLLSSDPLAQLKLPKVETQTVSPFTAEHLRALIAAARTRSLALRNETILYFLVATGVRASELCSLKRSDLDLRERRAKVFGKGRKWRWVSFDPTTAKLLVRYLHERGEGAPDEVFVSQYGEPLNRNSLRQMMAKLGRDAGIGDQVRVSPHTARHTFACTFLRAHPGALFHLQELLGHTDLSMVRRYARLVDGQAILEGPGPVELLGLDKPGRRR